MTETPATAAGDTPGSSIDSKLTRHFLAHQRLWVIGLVLLWLTINVLLQATTEIMEARRYASAEPLWAPFAREISSNLLVLLLLPGVILFHDNVTARYRLRVKLLLHALATLPFSVIHVAGMVAIRKLWYGLAGSQYQFGSLGYELLYEYRKDAITYVAIIIVVVSFRFIVRRLQGEALYVQQGEEASTTPPPDRLLVKKLGKEFLIAVSDIDWIEASGNYANLHVKQRLYPMRITMNKLEQKLPEQQFCRIHRSSIVNLSRVKHITPLESGDYEVTLQDAQQLSLSRRYRERFKEML